MERTLFVNISETIRKAKHVVKMQEAKMTANDMSGAINSTKQESINTAKYAKTILAETEMAIIRTAFDATKEAVMNNLDFKPVVQAWITASQQIFNYYEQKERAAL